MPESLFNKVADLRPATLLKKRLWHRCFPVNFANFLRTPLFAEHLSWLLLNVVLMSILLTRYRFQNLYNASALDLQHVIAGSDKINAGKI